MYCQNCGNKIEKDSNFCGNCGSNLKQNVENLVIIEEVENIKKVNFFVVPTGRLILFSILSFGFYSIYWFAKNFYAISERRKSRGKKTKEWWGIFNTITSDVLFSEFYLMHKEKTGKKFQVPSIVFSVLYFILMITSSYILLTPVVFIVAAMIFQSSLKKHHKTIDLYNYKKAKFNIKELLIVILGIAIIGLSYWSQQSEEVDTSYSVMQEVAESINEDLPEMVDEDTRIDYVTGGDDSLTYYYTLINNESTDFEYGIFQKDIKQGMIKNICINPDYDFYKENNIVLNYNYFDKNKNFIDKITIYTGTDCLQYNQ